MSVILSRLFEKKGVVFYPKTVMENRINIFDLTRPDLKQRLKLLGSQAYRADQIFSWLYQHGANNFSSMANLPLILRHSMSDYFVVELPRIVKEQNAKDGTRKLLLELTDGQGVECVLMPDGKKVTLCVSSQVGCRLGCAFCLTGAQGFGRNLLPGEIVGQVVRANQLLTGEKKIDRIVLMGMGEPLDNYRQVVNAIAILQDKHCLDLGPNRITLSTAGLIPELEKLAQEPEIKVSLAVSLNAADDKTRQEIMPIAKKYMLKPLLETLRRFPTGSARRITIEYVLLGGINDRPLDAKQLTKLLQGLNCTVNLIPFNECDNLAYSAPDEKDVLAFQKQLLDKNFRAFIRKSRGAEILAACGQLKGAVTQSG